MELIDKIMQIYPYLTINDFNPHIGTIHLQNNSDGNGTFIAAWNRPEPQPTQKQLNAIN